MKNIVLKFDEFIKESNEYIGEHEAPDSRMIPLYDLTKDNDDYGAYPDDFYQNIRQYAMEGEPYDSESISVILSCHNRPRKMVKIYRAVPDLNKDLKKQLIPLQNALYNYNTKGYFLPSDKLIIKKYRDNLEIENPDLFSFDSPNYDYNLEKNTMLENIKKDISDIESKLLAPIKINSGDWVTLSKSYAKEHGESNLNNKYKIATKMVRADELFSYCDSLNEFGYVAKTK